MMNDNYPLGAADDPRAPYNQVELPEKDFEVSVCQVLSKNTTISTDLYSMDSDEFYTQVTIDNDILQEVYREYYYTPLDIIRTFRNILHDNKPLTEEQKKFWINQCDEWVEDDFSVCQ